MPSGKRCSTITGCYLLGLLQLCVPLPVMAAADVDASDDPINISDLMYLIDYMFTGGPPPVCP